jgi:integrase
MSESVKPNTTSYPTVTLMKDQRVYVSYYLNGERKRIFSGIKLGIPIEPNKEHPDKRLESAQKLAYQVYLSFNSNRDEITSCNPDLTDIEKVELALKEKLSNNYSVHHITALRYTFRSLVKNVSVDGKITRENVLKTLNHFSSATSFNTMRRNLNVLFNAAKPYGFENKIISSIGRRRELAVLHKPFDDVRGILGEIKAFNYNLYICCLLTYGCLLRPHREIRELKWSDFSNDRKIIRLGGSRNKNGKNRVLPVPQYILSELKSNNGESIFQGFNLPPNPFYFKTLWSRFKKRNISIETNQTLYSFRHSGALNIYNRTKSLEKVKVAMGHSSIIVTLGYLRGFDITELVEQDLPHL